jgi:hypothetical protein
MVVTAGPAAAIVVTAIVTIVFAGLVVVVVIASVLLVLLRVELIIGVAKPLHHAPEWVATAGGGTTSTTATTTSISTMSTVACNLRTVTPHAQSLLATLMFLLVRRRLLLSRVSVQQHDQQQHAPAWRHVWINRRRASRRGE